MSLSNTLPHKMNKSNTATNTERILYLNRELDRLVTFASWTKTDVDKHKLAKYGFYYRGPDDTVECVYCRVIITQWDIGDEPLVEHIYWSPSCPFLLHKAPVNMAIEENFENQLPSPIYFVDIIYSADDIFDQANRPTQKIVLTGELTSRHPAYRHHDDRLVSFEKWPRSLKQTPQVMSEAGLFYLGISDHVKCFHCGGALRDWDEDDEPWIEHAKHFGHCDYVKQIKGEDFIAQSKHCEMETDCDNDASSIADDDETILSENESESIGAQCKCNICQDKDLNTIYLPCMHVYACLNCSSSTTNCPICNKKILEIKKCFLS